MLFKVAWRNVWRSKTRSAIVISSIAVGVWALVAGTGFMNGFLESYVANEIDHNISNIQVHHPDFHINKEIDFTINNAEEKRQFLANTPGVKAATKRVLVNGMIASAKKASGVQIRGIDVENERLVTQLDTLIAAGAYFEGIKRNPVVIGTKLAKELDVKIRSKIVLTFSDIHGEMISAAFRVVGIIDVPAANLNELTAFVRDTDLQLLVDIKNSYHEIAVLTTVQDQEQEVISIYKQKYTNDLIEDWKEISPNLAYMKEMYGKMLYYLMGIILTALVFGIINTMLMAVLERVKEFGMLMAIGMNRLKIFSMVVIETIFLGVIGTPIGLFLGYINVAIYSEKGVDMSSYSEGLEAYGYSSELFPYLDPSVYVIVSLGVFFTTVIGAAYPAYKAVSLKPVEAIHKI